MKEDLLICLKILLAVWGLILFIGAIPIIGSITPLTPGLVLSILCIKILVAGHLYLTFRGD